MPGAANDAFQKMLQLAGGAPAAPVAPPAEGTVYDDVRPDMGAPAAPTPPAAPSASFQKMLQLASGQAPAPAAPVAPLMTPGGPDLTAPQPQPGQQLGPTTMGPVTSGSTLPAGLSGHDALRQWQKQQGIDPALAGLPDGVQLSPEMEQRTRNIIGSSSITKEEIAAARAEALATIDGDKTVGWLKRKALKNQLQNSPFFTSDQAAAEALFEHKTVQNGIMREPQADPKVSGLTGVGVGAVQGLASLMKPFGGDLANTAADAQGIETTGGGKVARMATGIGKYAVPGAFMPALAADTAESGKAVLDKTGNPYAATGAGLITALSGFVGAKGADKLAQVGANKLGQMMMNGEHEAAKRVLIGVLAEAGAGAGQGATQQAIETVGQEINLAATKEQSWEQALANIRDKLPSNVAQGALGGAVGRVGAKSPQMIGAAVAGARAGLASRQPAPSPGVKPVVNAADPNGTPVAQQPPAGPTPPPATPQTPKGGPLAPQGPKGPPSAKPPTMPQVPPVMVPTPQTPTGSTPSPQPPATPPQQPTAQTPPAPPPFDVPTRAQELLDNGDAETIEEATDMARMEERAAARATPPEPTNGQGPSSPPAQPPAPGPDVRPPGLENPGARPARGPAERGATPGDEGVRPPGAPAGEDRPQAGEVRPAGVAPGGDTAAAAGQRVGKPPEKMTLAELMKAIVAEGGQPVVTKRKAELMKQLATIRSVKDRQTAAESDYATQQTEEAARNKAAGIIDRTPAGYGPQGPDSESGKSEELTRRLEHDSELKRLHAKFKEAKTMLAGAKSDQARAMLQKHVDAFDGRIKTREHEITDYFNRQTERTDKGTAPKPAGGSELADAATGFRGVHVQLTPERQQLLERVKSAPYPPQAAALLGDKGEKYLKLRAGGEHLVPAVIKAMGWDQQDEQTPDAQWLATHKDAVYNARVRWEEAVTARNRDKRPMAGPKADTYHQPAGGEGVATIKREGGGYSVMVNRQRVASYTDSVPAWKKADDLNRPALLHEADRRASRKIELPTQPGERFDVTPAKPTETTPIARATEGAGESAPAPRAPTDKQLPSGLDPQAQITVHSFDGSAKMTVDDAVARLEEIESGSTAAGEDGSHDQAMVQAEADAIRKALWSLKDNKEPTSAEVAPIGEAAPEAVGDQPAGPKGAGGAVQAKREPEHLYVEGPAGKVEAHRLNPDDPAQAEAILEAFTKSPGPGRTWNDATYTPETTAAIYRAVATRDKVHREGLKPMSAADLWEKAGAVGKAGVQAPHTQLMRARYWVAPGKEKQFQELVSKADKEGHKAVKAGPTAVKGTPRSPWPAGDPHATPRPVKTDKERVGRLMNAAASETSRYAIGGINIADDGATAVSTDGRRMWMIEGKKGQFGKDGLYLRDKNPGINKGEMKHTAEGAFPPYRDVIPKLSKTPLANVDLADTLRYIRQAAVMTTEGTRSTAVLLNPDGTLGFAAVAHEAGQAEVNVQDGYKLLGHVNPDFFAEALEFLGQVVGPSKSPVNGEHIQRVPIWWENGRKPLVMQSKGDDGTVATTVTMPVNGVEKLTTDAKPAEPEPAKEPEPAPPPAKKRGKAKGGGQGSEPNDLPDALGAPKAAFATPNARIKVDPIAGGKPKPLKQIFLDLSKTLGTVRTQKPENRRWSGTYYPGSARTIIRYAGDLDVAAHEMGHRLDDLYGLVAAWAGKRQIVKSGKNKGKPGMRFVPSPFDAELIPHFSGYGSGTRSGPRSAIMYHRAEGVAEWLRAYMVNPKAAEAAAPKFAAHFRATVPKEVVARIDAFGTDIRTFAGASATDKTLANIKSDDGGRPSVKAMVDRVKDALRAENIDGNWIDRLGAAWVDELRPVWRAIDLARKVRGIDTLLPSDDPKTLARLLGGVDNKITRYITEGPVTPDGTKVAGVGGLEWLLEPLKHKNATPAEVREDFRAVQALLVSERVREKAEQIKKAADDAAAAATSVEDALKIKNAARLRVQRLSGAGGGIQSDEGVALEAIHELASDPARLARLREAAARYRAFAESTLDYQVAAGRLSKESADEIKKSNQFYANMQRVSESVSEELNGKGRGGGRKLGTKRELVKTFKGGTRELDNPYVNLMHQAGQMVKEADRNLVLSKMRDLLTNSRGMYQGPVQQLEGLGHRVATGTDDSIVIFKNGAPEHWVFAPDVYRALKGWGAVETPNAVQALLRGMASVLRSTITLMPAFQVRNKVRDAAARSILSEHGAKPWGELYYLTPTGQKQYQSDLRDYEVYGGGNFGHMAQGKEQWHKEITAAVAKVAGEKTIFSTPKALFDGYKRLGEVMESTGRLDEYRRAFKHAQDELGYGEHDAHLYAAAQGRDLLDFAVAGRITRRLNQYIPFTNAAVQSLAKTIRAGRANPKGFAARWALYALLPTLGTALWNLLMGDKDDHEEYRQLPAYQRDFFWNYKVGPDLWVRIPKPFELGVAASGMERAIDRAMGNEHAGEGWGGSMAKSLVPLDESATFGALRGPIESITNYDSFKNGPIVPYHEDKLALEFRNPASASRIGKLLQDVIGMDARKVDHLLRSQLGGTGDLALKASDIGRGDKPGAVRSAAGSLVGVTAQSPATVARDVADVFAWARRYKQESSAAVRELSRLRKVYFAAAPGRERDDAAKALREYATQLRESIPPDQTDR